ncbi:MAG: YolD-like family protein [Clostridiales bacterium]|nr:YolD-like family protein [Clostridiales bacterium]
MDLTQRAKIFSPFSAVRGSEEKAKEEESKLTRVMRRELSEEDIRQFNETICNVRKKMIVEIEYFLPDADGSGLGEYVKISGKVTEINPTFRFIKIVVAEEVNLAKPEHSIISFADMYKLRVLS